MTGGFEGSLIDGRFELVERLGGGGMGLVWRARDVLLRRDVALKEVRPPDPELLRLRPDAAEMLRGRVLREARSLARISHPHVVTIHHIVSSAEVEHPWLVMELVAGGSLQDRLERGPCTAAETARLGRGVLAGLRAAHGAGILHRDVKPGNVLLRVDGAPVLTDFGIAAVREATSLTNTGELIGSPDYMAPERLRGREEDPSSDLWSLAMMLYVAVEGWHPMRRSSTLATLAAILEEEVPPPRRAGALGPVLRSVLVKDVAARPDAEALDLLLAEAAGERVVTVIDGAAVPLPGAGPARGSGSAPAAYTPTEPAAPAPAPADQAPAAPAPAPAGPAPAQRGPAPEPADPVEPGPAGVPAGADAASPGPAGPQAAASGAAASGAAAPEAAGRARDRSGPPDPPDPGPGGGPPPADGADGAEGSDGADGAGPSGEETSRTPVAGTAATKPRRRLLVPALVLGALLTGLLAREFVPDSGGDSSAAGPSPTPSAVRTPASDTGSSASPSPSATPSPTPEKETDLLTPSGARRVLREVKAVTGGTKVFPSFRLYPDSASGNVLLADEKVPGEAVPGKRLFDGFDYEDGRGTLNGNLGIVSGQHLMDLDRVDWDVLPRLLRIAQTELGVQKPDPEDSHVVVDWYEGQAALLVYANGAYRTGGILITTFDGKIIRRARAT